MIEHIEKELNRYVIATFHNPTTYLIARGNCAYSFIDNIQACTKFSRYEDAKEVYNSCVRNYDIELVILPMKIKYVLLEQEDGD